MPIEVINTGIYPNDGLGDPLRTAYTKINQNFTQFAPVAFTGQYSSLYGVPSFSRVAYTGQYTDLLGTPVLGLLAFLNTINNTNWFGMPLSINHGGTGQVTAPAAFDALSPMSAWGDMIFGKQFGQGYRLPIGADGQVMVVSNGEPSWTNPTIPVINEIIDISNNQVTNITNELPAVTLPAEGAYVHYGVATGTNVLSTSVYPQVTSYIDGIFIELLCSNYNTGAVTLSNDGMGPLPVRWPDGTELASHTLIPGGVVYLTLVNNAFQLIAGASAVGGGFGSAQRVFNIQTFTNNGTYIPTQGATRAVVFATGGGGAGGCYPTGGGGGGAGATAIALVNLTGVSSVSCVIGAGGLGIAVPQAGISNGHPGGQTAFGSYAIAGGGMGGQQPIFDYTNQNATGGFGGTMAAGLFGLAGGDGFHGIGVASPGNIAGGVGGGSFWGGGGDGAATYTGQGSPGRAYGAGGGGANSGCTVRIGGDGCGGIIVIVEFS